MNKTLFDKAIEPLDLTYAQVELIKQAVENHIICKDIDTSELMNQSLGTAVIMNAQKELQRKALRGEE